MKKKNYLSLLVTLTALGIAGGIHTSIVKAEGEDGADKSLLPVVFLTLDTSGSMLNSPDTYMNVRFTDAIQELTGRASVDTSDKCKNAYSTDLTISDCIIHPNDVRFPRKELTCEKDNDRCYYKTIWVCGSDYKTNGNRGKGGNGRCDVTFTNDGASYSWQQFRRAHRLLINGFEGNEASFDAQYTNTGIIQSYMNTVKFGMAAMALGDSGGDVDKYYYGHHVTKVPGFEDGDLNGSEYHYGFSGLPKTGAWGNEIKLYTPLLYPTTSDEINDVRASNEALIYNIRSYTIRNWATPLGGMLKAISYMFSNEMEGGKPDPALILQPKPTGKYLEPIKDEAWSCRPKAVIALTDGVPSYASPSSCDSAFELYKLGVKVYAVAYGDKTASPVGTYTNVDTIMNLSETAGSNPGILMNKIAWKGGTCREYGHTGNIIHPEDEVGYKQYLANYLRDPGMYRPCFYNAFSGTALREALTSVISELMEGYTSKSKMVTTTAVGKLTTVDDANKPVNGWYNVYSGYKVNLGAMRNSGLQRETYACRDGEFKYDKSLFINMAEKLDNRLTGCRSASMLEGTSDEGPKGSCMTNRAIFVGDYSDEVDRDTTGRYAIKPMRIHFTESGAGVFHYGDVSDSHTYQFFAYNNELQAEYNTARTSDIRSQNEYTNQQVMQYMISPYECKSEIDCISKAHSVEEQYLCDKGKCVLQSEFDGLTSCVQGLSRCNSTTQVCVSGQCRPKVSQCSSHNDCMAGTVGDVTYSTENQVCHAGSCVNGVLIDGDIRDLIASIPLGAIEYASPVIVGPPGYSYRGADYVTYKNKYADRDTMLYVPANDGMLHAFILGKNNTKTYSESMFDDVSSPKIGKSTPRELEGEELWAFIPKTVMKNMHTLTDFGEQKKINVAPVYADVQFPDGEGGGEWHSVIVGGFREGGRGYYALDVTEPNDPKILWEIDNQWQSKSIDAPHPEISDRMALSEVQDQAYKAEGLYPFARMGYSYPEAIITNVIVDNEIVPVAVLSGGVKTGEKTTDCNAHGDCFPDVTGHAVFVVRLNPSTKEDLLVREFLFDTSITSTPAAFPAGFNSIARVIYVGDENGALHRIDVSDPNMDNWKIDNVSVTTDGKVARPNGKLHPIFDPNNIDVLQGTPRKTYEKMTYKPAVSAVTATGYPDIQIVFGSGDSSVTSVGLHDLNYTAIAIDHYVNGVGYQLNNFNSSHDIDAKTSYIDPLVIVFNPTPGITSKPLASYDVPNAKKQYFEVWAGKVADDPPEEPPIIPIDPCDTCTEEECTTNASCAACPYCVCINESKTCEVEKQNCENAYSLCQGKYALCDSQYQTCEKRAQEEYDDCLNNKEVNCSECITEKINECEDECSESCTTTCEDEINDNCETKAENQFCEKVWKDSILATVTHLWGSDRVCKRTIGKIKTVITDNEYLLSDPDYCGKAKESCVERCDNTTWWESKVGYAEAYAQCLKDWANNVNVCVRECNEDINYCEDTSRREFNSCRKSCKWYQVACHAHNLGCDISYAAKLVACGVVWTGCTANCTVGQIAICTAQAISHMLLSCKTNCETDKWDCDIRKGWYQVLKQFYDKYMEEFLICQDEVSDARKECERERIECETNCSTTCRDTDVTTCDSICKGECEKKTCEKGDDCKNECVYSCKECNECIRDDANEDGIGSEPSKSRAAKRAAGTIDMMNNIRAGQKMMGAALTYNFKNYFPTYNATLSTGACNDGFASIWSVDRSNSALHWNTKSTSQVQNQRAASITGATDHGKSSTSFETNYYINLANGTKVYGLAMTPQAICVNNRTNKAQIAAPQLIAQTGKAPGTSSGTESSANNFNNSGEELGSKDVTNISVLSITEDAIKPESNVLSWASVYE